MQEKTILITGGTTGIGLATAQLLSGESLGIAPSDDDFCALGDASSSDWSRPVFAKVPNPRRNVTC